MNGSITIKKINEVWFHVTCSMDIKYELSDYFKFQMPNYRFSPAFKFSNWDGTIRLFHVAKSLLHIGLLPHLKSFCTDSDYSLLFENDPVYGMPDTNSNFTEQEIRDYLDSLNVHSNGNKINIHDYQYNAIINSITKKRMVIISATASGKSLMVYGITRFILNQGKRVLIVCPTTQLVEQMASDFADYSSHNNWDSKRNIHKIHSGADKKSNTAITVSTWQSLQNLDPSWFKSYDAVIIDECHLAKAKSLTSILESCTNASYRLGLTGSLDKSVTNKMCIQGLLGEPVKISSSRDLIDRGVLTDIKIYAIMLGYSKSTMDAYKQSSRDWKKELDYLTAHEKRNKFIVNLAASKNNNTLIFFSYVDHGKQLFKLMKEKCPDKEVIYISGDINANDRETARQKIEESNNIIIIASSQTSSTGVNFKNLHNIIFSTPTKSIIRVLQSIGRGLRKSANKDIINVYDIGDNLVSTKSKKNHSYLHFVERLKIYSEQSFPYKLIEMVVEK